MVSQDADLAAGSQKEAVMVHARWLAGTLALATLTGAGCSAPPAPTPTAEPSATGFAPFGLLRIKVVRLSATDDDAELWFDGAAFEADRLGVNATFSDAQGDAERQAIDMQSAIDAQPQVIVIDRGAPETMQPLVADALDAGIKVVTFGLDPGDDRASEVVIDDEELAQQIIDTLVDEIGGAGDVIYVYAPGEASVDRRDAVWRATLEQHPGIAVVAQVGQTPADSADAIATGVADALQANPDTVAVVALSDEWARGAAQAVMDLDLQDAVHIYGAGIVEADIAAMIADGSPWVAAASTDPYAVGAVTLRCSVVGAQGLDVDRTLAVPPVLITQERLLAGGITNMLGLREEYPAVTAPNTCTIQR
jgi:simple sugar transport system substrate-binding protein